MSLLLSLLPLLLRHYDPPIAPEFQDPFLKAFYLILGMCRLGQLEPKSVIQM